MATRTRRVRIVQALLASVGIMLPQGGPECVRQSKSFLWKTI